jgi:hypothetical protein
VVDDAGKVILEQKVSPDPANSGIFAAGLENIGFLRPGSG